MINMNTELSCLRNKSFHCWKKVIGLDYVESHACTTNIECPGPFMMSVSE